MKKIQYLILGTITIFVFSCSQKNNSIQTYKGNIDEGDWIGGYTIGNYGGVTGDHCSKVDTVNQYSFGFRKLISEISPDPIKKIKTSVWVKLDDINKKTLLVVSLNGKDGKNILWTGHELNTVVKAPNKWFKLDVEDVLPEFDSEGAQIEIYVWNNNKNVAYIDDMNISFLSE